MRNLEGLKFGWGWNKGTKGIMKANSTSFKKGMTAKNAKPKLEKTCKCGAVFYVKPSLDRVKCCSISCAKKGTTSPMKGRKVSDETRYKQRMAKLGKTGELCPNYIKDRSLIKLDTERGGPLHKEWSRSVKTRDKWKCRIADDKCNGKLEAHHILGWSEHPELRYKINNGITLCHAHHPRKRAEEKRLIPTFMELVSVSSK